MSDTGQGPSRFTAWQPAPADARFDLHAFEAQIGQKILVTLPGTPPRSVERVLKAAVVAADGSSVELTFEAEATDVIEDDHVRPASRAGELLRAQDVAQAQDAEGLRHL